MEGGTSFVFGRRMERRSGGAGVKTKGVKAAPDRKADQDAKTVGINSEGALDQRLRHGPHQEPRSFEDASAPPGVRPVEGEGEFGTRSAHATAGEIVSLFARMRT
jgi:hypothetical protein